MRTKHNAFFGNARVLRERENLKATAVRQYRTIPAHEPMQPTEVGNDLLAGSKCEMVRVREHHLCAGAANRGDVEAFHRGERADRHERRCLNRAVRRLKGTATSSA